MKVLFVQGPKKTATSSLTGLLNCHPDIFVLFENYVAQTELTKYGNQLLERYPEARQFFKMEDDYGKPILEFFSYLKKREPEYSYKFVGTKMNSMNATLTQAVQNHKIIFTNRDIRSWLVKESVIKYYRTDLDIVAPSIDYLRYTIQAARYHHAFHFWLEEFISNQKEVINRLSNYLGLELSKYADNWWENFGVFDEKDPKSVFKLDHVHHSSKVEPSELDTQVSLRDIPFWSAVCPLFDKYYMKPDCSMFSISETDKDLKTVEELKKFAPLPFTEAYLNVDSVRIGFSNQREIHYQYPKRGQVKKSLPSMIFRFFKQNLRRKEIRH